MNGWIRGRQFIVVVFGKSMQVACEWLIREKYLSTSPIQCKPKEKKEILFSLCDWSECVISQHMTQTWDPADTGTQKNKSFKFHRQPRQPTTLQQRPLCGYRLNMISCCESRLSSIYCQTPMKLCVSKERFTPFNSVQWEGLSHHIRNFKSPLA